MKIAARHRLLLVADHSRNRAIRQAKIRGNARTNGAARVALRPYAF